MIRALPPVALVALAVLTACVDPGGDYPALLPTQTILAEPVLPPHAAGAAATPAAAEADAAARAADLAARAQGLRGPVIEPWFRQQMQAARER